MRPRMLSHKQTKFLNIFLADAGEKSGLKIKNHSKEAQHGHRRAQNGNKASTCQGARGGQVRQWGSKKQCEDEREERKRGVFKF